MYKVYILQSLKDNRTYVGYTKDLEQRLKNHNSGQVRSTKHRIPFKVLFSENFENMREAKKRELWWKSKSGRTKLKEFFLKILKQLNNFKGSRPRILSQHFLWIFNVRRPSLPDGIDPVKNLSGRSHRSFFVSFALA